MTIVLTWKQLHLYFYRCVVRVVTVYFLRFHTVDGHYYIACTVLTHTMFAFMATPNRTVCMCFEFVAVWWCWLLCYCYHHRIYRRAHTRTMFGMKRKREEKIECFARGQAITLTFGGNRHDFAPGTVRQAVCTVVFGDVISRDLCCHSGGCLSCCCCC